jgi:hypothetical protein
VSGVLLLAGGLMAALRGQAQLGQVCTVLGAVFLAVAARLWVAPRRRRHARAVTGDAGGRSAPEAPDSSGEAGFPPEAGTVEGV